MKRLTIQVSGTVQGVGFRPFVHRAAVARGLAGFVWNDGRGVTIVVQGADSALSDFIRALRDDAPPAARVGDITTEPGEPVEASGFQIRTSVLAGDETSPTLPADRAPCQQCLREMADPSCRRFRYPFTNCTDCGPRYTVTLALPYDRSNTTMREFVLCPECAREYGDPADRRFHAEPVACPACGPELRWVRRDGGVDARGWAALECACEAIAEGAIVAVKGVGGYQLTCDATSERAVATLRARKRRPDKAFAVMFSSISELRAHATVDPLQEEALSSAAAPIVLVAARRDTRCPNPIATGVSRSSPWLGAMMPSSPLHRLLMDRVGRPIVCTSGNVSDEPICVHDAEALDRLGDIADAFLMHNRPIARPVDDSLIRIGPTGEEILRRARGYAPTPLARDRGGPTILALGGHFKSTIALGIGSDIIISQHLGDLDTTASQLLLERTVTDFLDFYRARPDVVACDEHPDFASTLLAQRLADKFAIPIERVQHHHAHVAACLAEHRIEGAALGFAWDGSGLGDDGRVWGGECLVLQGAHAKRVAHIRAFRLPGGDRAAREPRRSAIGVLFELLGDRAMTLLPGRFSPAEERGLVSMLRTETATPWTTSIGRLFDAVACIAGVRDVATFEGQAAMDLEALAEPVSEGYAFALHEHGGIWIADWQPVIESVVEDLGRGVSAGVVSGRFHAALSQMTVEIARRAACSRVALTGGCFQSRLLSIQARTALEQTGFEVISCSRVPPNDGGLSLGQAWVAMERWKERQDVSRHSR